ncbi:MAG: hypothetical protein DHS20C13_22220 [Thermodesulfobacteriota bacterium]|nr:MAG: hypothetical protein DHS20C13_22220 [Thermodesulfobacteriota bacterium]GJM35918.1 MAG: hypothetical protein DHS20C18_49190 [Saprospiraceae bacterium]
MSIDVLKSELSKLNRAELLDVIQYGIEVMKDMEEGEFETPDWLKAEMLKRAGEMKSGKTGTHSWDDVKTYAKASNG